VDYSAMKKSRAVMVLVLAGVVTIRQVRVTGVNQKMKRVDDVAVVDYSAMKNSRAVMVEVMMTGMSQKMKTVDDVVEVAFLATETKQKVA
jgi:hypothetical protein